MCETGQPAGVISALGAAAAFLERRHAQAFPTAEQVLALESM